MKGNLYITNGNFGKYTIHRKLYNTNGELYKSNKENTCTIQIEKKIHSADTIHIATFDVIKKSYLSTNTLNK